MLPRREGSGHIKAKAEETCGIHGMQPPTCRTITNTTIRGGYSQCVCFILILIIAQYERSYYYLYFEGQEPEAREIIKLPEGTQFTS